MKLTVISTNFLLILSIKYSQQQEQRLRPLNEELGAISRISLDHGMSVYVNFTQTGRELVYSTWFNNPENYPYWENSLCLAIVVGTPGLTGQDHYENRCGFLPTFDASGRKDPFGSFGETCIKDQILMDPCRDKIKINNNCGSIMNLIPQYESLASTRYRGLHRITSSRLNITDDIKLNPDWYKTIHSQSMLIAYTDQADTYSQWRQKIACSNIELGNGTVENFDIFPRHDDGSYDFSYFPSLGSLNIMSPPILLWAVFLVLFTMFIT
ncbi:hypothetical protein MAM1_0157c06826 [Mucor ambiguus]|uniref:Uncharacterized protein n=1 Tax=Mucor ambiguus TaxID=91626 RepID=A0A0C9LVT4_9FUNG|nr:hypothetical protein MAM1_0157c06826 [Mucor ambiguus]